MPSPWLAVNGCHGNPVNATSEICYWGKNSLDTLSFQELIPFPEVSAWLNFENPHLYNEESKNQPGDSNGNAQLQLRHKAWHRVCENMRKYSRNGPLYMTHREYIAQSIVRNNKCTNRGWKIKSSFVWTILLGNLDILCPRLPFPSSFVRSERVSHGIAYNSQVWNSATCVIPAVGACRQTTLRVTYCCSHSHWPLVYFITVPTD